ncbi:AglZ/HisF2 family acetamidino modification protein [Desulfuromonas acetoxidans]|uniref:AglZ/HisF2 family acetamidino modification protein n=1 Tax=Desulfuromonas acetoxidans TaxID=891 RepID=UPI00292FCA06|nr:AglZ/HisF2 family acetamidino modification protein [Desulfuromonas acetoxidans]
MLYPRLIPMLLVHNKGLVKTVKFKDKKYVGDPLNAVKIFNEKKADELIVVDIDATVEGRDPDYKMIENLAAECRMPLCYGGGIKTVEQAATILGLGVEKVALSSSALNCSQLVTKLSQQVGTQSVVVVLDVKKKIFGGKYECFTHNGKLSTKICPFEFAKIAEEYGAGEILINSIDNDGVMKGYDLDLIHKLKSKVTIPVTAAGGAGSLDDIHRLYSKEQIIGAAAGSLFVFKGKYRAVLINYPSSKEKKDLISGSL